MSKDELLEKVWNGRFIFEATLSSRIKAVRQLIGDTGKKQAYLQTVRHRGFRYAGEVQTELTETRRITSQVAAASPGTPKTGVAVMPFEMVSEGPEQAYVGEGFAADVIALLARHRWLRVIAGASSFALSARRATPEEVGAALDVGYLLSGRIRRSDGRVRIDAELTDCRSGRLLWSEVYDLQNSDLSLIHEDMAEQIAATLEPRLGQLERQRIGATRSEDLDAWD